MSKHATKQAENGLQSRFSENGFCTIMVSHGLSLTIMDYHRQSGLGMARDRDFYNLISNGLTDQLSRLKKGPKP